MKKQDFIFGGDPKLEAALRKRVKKAIFTKKDRVPELSKLWLKRLGERQSELGRGEASLLMILLRHFEYSPLPGVPQLLAWLRWSSAQLRSLRSSPLKRSRV